ncbi:Peptidoglycan O-acetyltransferase [Planctomycetes bacterium CA13]|uniref:Peptidoglycan O-acetyltransferase n=1 Tax=Novipirellula herctigrandis TaxID=2527986 RepID=A0A5C5Z1G8_9BACT|nr:Peptidoglycan O-acetyltransferase [Planctomycetes bacterium CA13]
MKSFAPTLDLGKSETNTWLTFDAMAVVWQRRAILFACVTSNLAILFTFKYWDFFSDSVNSAFQLVDIPAQFPELNLLLPMGISFYTFQSLSYTVDVYKRAIPAEKHFGYFALYVVYFPQLVAGPIERAGHLLPQLRNPIAFDYDRFSSGIQRIVWGMFKKIFIADRLGNYVDVVYSSPDDFHGTAIAAATYFFAFQIYADFSAYSDIAIGSARIIGVDLMENFRQPYLSEDVGEFWRRWHISLSQFFRDYVYIPLGGGRDGALWRARNLVVVFLLSGLWHGAAWTYVIWGLLHGLLVIGSRHRNADSRWSIQRLFRVAVTFHLVLATWVLFRASSFNDATIAFQKMFVDCSQSLYNLANFQPRFYYWEMVLRIGIDKEEFLLCLVAIGVLLLSDMLCNSKGWFAALQRPRWRFARLAAFDAMIAITLLLGAFGKTQFIYFQF